MACVLASPVRRPYGVLSDRCRCFRRYLVSRGPDLGLRATKDGWYSMPCPAGPSRQAAAAAGGYQLSRLLHRRLGGCPEQEVFGALVRLGVPGECLKRPKGGQAARADTEDK